MITTYIVLTALVSFFVGYGSGKYVEKQKFDETFRNPMCDCYYYNVETESYELYEDDTEDEQFEKPER